MLLNQFVNVKNALNSFTIHKTISFFVNLFVITIEYMLTICYPVEIKLITLFSDKIS